MKALVKYIDFHADNYQGGSGKSFEMTFSFDIPDDLLAVDIFELTHKKIKERSLKTKPFNADSVYSINSVEII